MQQLSFLEETKEDKLEKEIEMLKDQCERVRKAQFGKIAALTKLINELSYQLETMNSSICKGEVIGFRSKMF
jgi:flagellar hook-associated protein FlgK